MNAPHLSANEKAIQCKFEDGGDKIEPIKFDVIILEYAVFIFCFSGPLEMPC